jgi:D-alanyl-D-alanine carboxypeptidase
MLRPDKSFIKKRRVFLAVIVLLPIVFATFIFCYYTYQQQAILANKAASQANTSATNTLIAQIKTNKAAKAAQELAAQQKAAAETKAAATKASSCNTDSTHSNPASIDVLVNKKHCLVPLSYYPSDLVVIDGATISSKAATSFDQMYKAAAAAGQPFAVSSSYRSYATQITTYNYWISISGQTGADTYSARPGYSEHQTGFAVDVKAGSCALSCFINTTQYTWLQTHAADYGFIQRYPSGGQSITGYESEEWHYRYVGVAVAQDMKSRGITTLEQYWGLSGGDYAK